MDLRNPQKLASLKLLPIHVYYNNNNCRTSMPITAEDLMEKLAVTNTYIYMCVCVCVYISYNRS